MFKRAVHECLGQPESCVPRLTPRRAPRLCRVGRGRDSQETVAQSGVFFSRRGEESERSGITLPDARGWSTQVAAGSGVTVSLGKGGRGREAFARSGAV